MTKTIDRLKYGFFALFLLGSAASAYYSIFVVKPRQDCENKGAWWDPDERVCATPVDISLFTGRPRPPGVAAPVVPPAQPGSRVAPGTQSTSAAPS